MEKSEFTRLFKDLYRMVQTVPAISPSKYVTAMQKQAVLELYEKQDWGVHLGFFFQTCNMREGAVEKGSSAFFIYKNPCDGIRAVASALREGCIASGAPNRPRVILSVMSINELPLPGAITNPIFDLELETALVKRPVEEIKEAMHDFLGNILEFWTERGILKEGFTEVFIKDKTRVLKQGHKVSMHAVMNIVALKEMHDKAQHEFLECKTDGVSHRQGIERDKEAVKSGKIPDKIPKIFWDFTAGRYNGISVAGSRKRPTDPRPEFKGRFTFFRGCLTEHEACQIPMPHDPNTLEFEDLCRLLWMQCYTTPKWEAACHYSDAFMEHAKEKTPKVFIFFLEPPLGFEPIHP